MEHVSLFSGFNSTISVMAKLEYIQRSRQTVVLVGVPDVAHRQVALRSIVTQCSPCSFKIGGFLPAYTMCRCFFSHQFS